MTTATAIAARERDLKREVFHRHCAAFYERWAPEDRYEAAEFYADFYSLVQDMFAEAARPMQDAMTAAFATVPMTKFFGDKI